MESGLITPSALIGTGAAKGVTSLVVGKAEGRQWRQLLEFLLIAPLPGGIEGAEHLGQQFAVFGGFLEITAAAQDQLLLQPPFHMAMGCLDDAVLVGHAAVVAAGGQAVVGAEDQKRMSLDTSIRTTPEALLQQVRDRWSIEGWHWIRDTQLHDDAHRYRGNGAGVMATLRTAALNLLRLTGFRSIRSGMQAVMHDITALLAMAMRQPEPKPC